MKKYFIFFSLLVSIIAAFTPMTAQAQQSCLINWQNGEMGDAFIYSDVDSITYSKVGLDNKVYPNVVVQEVWNEGNAKRIPIATIDSVTFKGPKTQFNPDVFHIRDFHYPYVREVTDLTVTFDASIPTDSLPVKDQVIISDRIYEEPFMHGFSGRVDTIITSGNVVRIVCKEVQLKDIFLSIFKVGKVVATSNDSIPARMSNRSIIDIIDEADVVTLPFDLEPFNLIESGSSHISLDIDPVIKIDYLIYIGVGEKDKVRFDFDNTMNCSFDFDWDSSYSLNLEHYPDFSSKSFPIAVIIPPAVTLNAFINLGAFLDFSANADLGLSLPFTMHSKIGFDSQRPGLLNDFYSVFDKPVFHYEYINGHADFNASLSAGIVLEAGLSIIDEDLLNFNFKLKTGPRLSGGFKFDTNLSDDWSWYRQLKDSHITFEPLTSTLSCGVNVAGLLEKDFPITELNIPELFPSLAPRTLNLFPEFQEPHLPGLQAVSNGYSLTALTEYISKDLIFPVYPGIKLTNGNQEHIYYSKSVYKEQDKWKGTDLQMELQNYPAGTYTATPIFKFFDNKVDAEPSSTVTIPNPLSVQNSVAVMVGETETIQFTGGWGNYTLSSDKPNLCLISLVGHSIIITGKENGTAKLTLTDVRSNETKEITVTVSGSAPSPILIVDQTSLDFGTVTKGYAKSMTFTVTSSGLNGSLNLQSSNSSLFSVSPTTITASEASAGKTVTVTYKPTAVGSQSATITISGGGATTNTVSVSGTCEAGYINVSPATLDFSTLSPGASKTLSFTVTTNGTVLKSTFAETIGGEFPNPPSVTGPGTYSVTFKPTQAGSYGGTINIIDTKSGATAKVTLVGKCATTITPTPTSLKFGTVTKGYTKSLTFTVKSSGLNGSLNLQSSNSSLFSVSPTTITASEASAGKTVTVTYKPTAVGSQSATITISGGGATTNTVSVSGTCEAGYINVSPATLDFSTLSPGASKTLSFTVTTNGTVLKSTFAETIGGEFPNPPSVTGPGTYSVTFKPTQAGSYGGTINIIDTKSGATAKVTLVGKCATPTINVTPSELKFGNIPYGSKNTKTFTVTGSNLTGNLTVKSSDKVVFSVSPTSIAPAQAAAGATVTVTYSPSTVHTGNKQDTGTITVSGGGAASKTVVVSGRGINASPY